MITRYSDEYIADLKKRFLEKFKADTRSFGAKLDAIFMPKGTYSYLINNEKRPQKRTLETMRAYLENRPPKFLTLKLDEFYCCCCETIQSEDQAVDQWVCRSCSAIIKRGVKNKRREHYYQLRKKWYTNHIKAPGAYREEHLLKRKRLYLKKNYGKLAQCVELIENIKKEMRKHGKT